MSQVQSITLSSHISRFPLTTSIEIYMHLGKLNCIIAVHSGNEITDSNIVSSQFIQFDKNAGVTSTSYNLKSKAALSYNLAPMLGTQEIESLMNQSLTDLEHHSKAYEMSQRISKGITYNLKSMADTVFSLPFPEDNNLDEVEHKGLIQFISSKIQSFSLLV